MTTENAYLRCAVLALTMLLLRPAHATVTQVDGTIIPVAGSNVQSELNGQGETTLDAVLDAAEQPEVFLPNTSQAVTFTDFAEFAGFENSIGWYNVGDDIVTANGRAANLHPILGCGVPMQDHAFDPLSPDTGHHHGDPSMYIQNAEPTVSISVDFAAEETAGRYKGGFIGFYIITPEDNEDGNCGDFIDEADGDSRFGYIYHTQKDLNDDGDFVHHLVYTSQVATDRFYFAFEDLFRGGDNDFADMMVQVDGLTPPCVPGVEICDGLDNDCDGLIDEVDPDLVGVGDSCLCDDVALTCADGPTFGVCQEGQTICTAGEIQCSSINGGASEICDSLDNDCNNAVDDNPAGVGLACDGLDADLCPEGITECVAGVLDCSDTTGNNEELCNGFDDDCDIAVDETPIDEGGSCGSSVGSCSPGVEVCVSGALDCQGETGPALEICNGLDDNCNGVSDDNPTDVGGDCGLTDVGPCSFGTLICNAGSPQCVGEIGPQSETCNLVDDDCNGVVDNDPIDVGSPCGTNVGVCEPGLIVCTATGPDCVGETTGTSELCNSLDDDCNGLIDDDPVGVDEPCGDSEGLCEPGLTKCINGGFECVGGFDGSTEICNGVDDDCDGVVDDGDLCGGGECFNGQCTSACDGGEFSCPVGQLCEDGFCVLNECFGVVCTPDADGTLRICEEGDCIAVCDTVSCPSELVCRNTDGFCVPDNCTFLPICAEDEVCIESVCEADPCFEVECGAAEFCREGSCFASCGGVDCAVAELCVDGACEPTGCAEDCGQERVCDAASGICVDDPCLGVSCEVGQVCNSTGGLCEPDPCIGIECPGETVCDFGGCYDPPEPAGDAGPDPVYVAPGGGGGCTVAGVPRSGSAVWLLLVAVAVLLTRRRIFRRLLGPIVVCGMSLQSLACTVNPYCVNCDNAASERDGGVGDGGVDPGDIDAGADAAPGCDDGVSKPEICNDLDDDCDGRIDEAFDLTTDFFNCGTCETSCEKSGTRTECSEGSCEATECFPGNVDINGDFDEPFLDSDGCEYSCFVSNGGIEACDSLDNDCDGSVDEDTDFQNDDNNCGQCGRVCGFFEAAAACTAAICSFDPATDCSPGFSDVNLDQADGCEYACSPSNGGVEVCDLIDNNCDGTADEGFDTTSDALHCGQCNRVCTFPNASPSCVASSCTFDPATDCDANFFDVNGTAADGCEYACTPSNGGVEVCDLIDNDCNGVVDDSAIDVNLACSNGPMGIPTGACTDAGLTVCSLGILVCVDAPEASAEVCNDVDDDCDGVTDEGVTQACYSGLAATEGVGLCVGGQQACAGGVFTGPCVGETTPQSAETCDNEDEDCDGQTDEAVGGGPLTQTCYDGTGGTAGFGECVAGEETCTFGVFGSCQGQVVDTIEICGDALDSDCDTVADGAEGCLVADPSESRLDGNGPLGTALGAEHSFDLVLASGGTPAGQRVYAAWSDLSNGNSDIYFARSLDGGATWEDVINLTGSLGAASVKPLIVTAADAAADDVHVIFQSVNGGVRDIRTVTSADSGATFTSPSSRLDGAEDSFNHHAAIGPSGTTLAVVWEELDTTLLSRNVVSRVSLDQGASFEGQRIINVGSGGAPIAGRPQVGISSTGRFIYVWREIRNGVTGDGFAAFSDSATAAIDPAAETRLDGDIGDEEEFGLPVLRVVEQAVYIVWQSISTVPGGGSDVVFVRSSDNGLTYLAEAIIDDPAAEQSASFKPHIDVDGAAVGASDDRVFIAWEDRREGTQIFASVSADGGQSFEEPLRVSSDSGAPLSGVTRGPRMIYADGDVLVVSYMNALAGEAEHVFAASSIDAGASWTFTHERMDGGIGNALNPVIVQANGGGLANGVCIGWNDFRSGTGINGDPYVQRVGQ